MNESKLKVSFVEKREPSPLPAGTGRKTARRIEAQAAMERLWHHEPEQFNPQRDCIQQQRVRVTLDIIRSKGSVTGKRIADLGCGTGVISRELAKDGAVIDCIDVATNALERLAKDNILGINPIHDCLPHTKLDDCTYDIVICTDVIPYLHPNEYRIFMAELARVVKADGIVVVSTAFDIDTEDPLEAFAALGETEFNIEQWVFSYHRLLIKCLRFFDAPARYANWRSNFLTSTFAILWKGISLITNPIAKYLRSSPKVMAVMDKITKILFQENGISAALFVGKRRPLTFPLPASEQPKEMKHKREVWE